MKISVVLFRFFFSLSLYEFSNSVAMIASRLNVSQKEYNARTVYSLILMATCMYVVLLRFFFFAFMWASKFMLFVFYLYIYFYSSNSCFYIFIIRLSRGMKMQNKIKFSNKTYAHTRKYLVCARDVFTNN